jgi:hypothetical protein
MRCPGAESAPPLEAVVTGTEPGKGDDVCLLIEIQISTKAR